MVELLKKHLYFICALYFKFFAQIRLSRWRPRIVVVTGSSGKTTLLHFLESQLKDHAQFSHHANSSIGVPFDILGLQRHTLKPIEWIGLFVNAPLKAFSAPPSHKLYVVECDCDRPYEGQFLATFLKPEVTLWITLSRTHTMNFDHLVDEGKFKTVEDAVAYEYGYFIENTSKLCIINGDSQYMKNQLKRTNAQIIQVTEQDYLEKYQVTNTGTSFTIHNTDYNFSQLHPKEVFATISMTKELLNYLQLPFDATFSNLHVPPGRTSVFKGIKGTTLIDSTYNANFSSMEAILKMFEQLTSDNKWAVLGDMRELGKEDKEEHEKLADLLSKMKLQAILLYGSSVIKYTQPKLESLLTDKSNVHSFPSHRELLEYLKANIQGSEVILFKASQSQVFEGFIEPLLENQADVHNLPRREEYWIEYRKQRGL